MAKQNSLFIMSLALLGLLDSTYISLSKYQCEACNSIHNTIWGQPLGFPIAWLGILMYAIIFVAILKNRPRIALTMSVLGAAGAVVLVLAQVLILKQYCVFCLISAGIIMTLWLLLWMTQRHWRPARQSWLLPLATLVVFVLLVQIYRPLNPLDIDRFAPVASTPPEQQTSNPGSGTDAGFAGGSGQEKPVSVVQMDNSDTTGDRVLPKDDQQPSAAATVPSPSNKQGLGFYSEAGNRVVIDVSREPILYIASRCETCSLVLNMLANVPPEKRPLIIDTWIPEDSNLVLERQNVQKKFQVYQLDSAQVLYDLDGLNPAPKVPRFENYSPK